MFLPEDAAFQGIEGLTPGEDYLISGNAVTVLKAALARFEPGEHVLNFLFAGDARAEVQLTVVDTGIPVCRQGHCRY